VKTAVVTGAAGAIGSAICGRLTEAGFRVVAVDVDEAGLARLGPETVPLVADLSRIESAEEIAGEVRDRTGRCDLLVNNAGVAVTTPFEEVSADEVQRELAVNLVAPVHLTHALFPLLADSRGHVVSVVSLAGMLPIAQSPSYSASKFGLRGFLLALAQRERETGVRISIVNPGAVDTPMLRYEVVSGGSPLNFLSEPLSPDEIAEAVLAHVRRPRLETNVPRYDGWLIKAAMLNPGLVGRLRPLLERLAPPNMERYRPTHAR
jgi:NAD(P)-dependent dehydrogenase (short-subunit alcohol dehydrogenase family)